jgi:hypothetical protein
MKRDEVPQDRLAHYGGARKAVYALGGDGHYETVASSGWDVEAIVTGDAVSEYQRLADEARQRAREGRASPLEYHMYARRLDVPTLAQISGIWRWRLRRHLRAEVFRRLPDRVLQRYAEALGMSLEELKRTD